MIKLNTIQLNLLICFIIILTFCSCSSFFYKGTSRCRNNNTVYISSAVDNFSVSYSDRKISKELAIERAESGRYKVVLPIVRANPRLHISKANRDDVKIYLNRSIRPRALIFSALMALPTYGLSLLIDPFKPTFYALTKSSQYIEIDLRYSQIYMREEFKKISQSSNARDFDDYAKKFPYSPYHTQSINSRDSIIVNNAINRRDESELAAFVKGNPMSKFYLLANEERVILERSRLKFESISRSTSPGIFNQFMTEFPKSLEYPKARDRFYIVSCDSIIGLSQNPPKWKFLSDNMQILNSIKADLPSSGSSSGNLTDRLVTHLLSNYQTAIQQANNSEDVEALRTDLKGRLDKVPASYTSKFQSLLAKSNDEFSAKVISELDNLTLTDFESIISFHKSKCKDVSADYVASINKLLDKKLVAVFESTNETSFNHTMIRMILDEFGKKYSNGQLGSSYKILSNQMYQLFATDYGAKCSKRDQQSELVDEYKNLYGDYFDVTMAGMHLTAWLTEQKMEKKIWPPLDNSAHFVSEYNKYMLDVEPPEVYSLIKMNPDGRTIQEVYKGNAKVGLFVNPGMDRSNSSDILVFLDSRARLVTDEYTEFFLRFATICNQNSMFELGIDILENFYSEMTYFSEGQKQKVEDYILASRNQYQDNYTVIARNQTSFETQSTKCIGGAALYNKQGIEYFNFILSKTSGYSMTEHDNQDLIYANCEKGRITQYQFSKTNYSGINHSHQSNSNCSSTHFCPFCRGTGSITLTISKSEQNELMAIQSMRRYFNEWIKTHTDYEDLKDRVERFFQNYK